MKKIAVVFCVLFSFSTATSAQTSRRTVTNFDLDKYRDQRVAAEREYRDTFAQRGMLSPEEIKAASDQRVQQTLDLALEIRQQNLEEQRISLEARAQQLELDEMRYPQQSMPNYYPYDSSIWGYGVYGDFGGGRFRRLNFRRSDNRGYYVGGGAVWSAPLGSRTLPLRPSFRTGTSRGRH